jgi:ABC-type multidrug transport system fused ATPase/permease subunit
MRKLSPNRQVEHFFLRFPLDTGKGKQGRNPCPIHEARAVTPGIRTAYRLLPPRSRKFAALLVIMMLINGSIEVGGVAGILPVVTLASDLSALAQFPWLQKLYNTMGFTQPKHFLVFLGGGFVALFACVNGCRALTIWLGLRFTFHVSHHLGVRLLRSYMSRTYLWLRMRNTADLSKDVLHEMEALVRNIYLPITEICMNGLASGMVALTLFVLDPKLAVGTGACLLGLFSLVYHFNRGQLGRNGELRDSLNALRYRAVQEGLVALKEGRMLPRREQFLERYHGLSRDYNEALAVGEIVYELPHYLTEIVAIAGLMAALVYFALRQEGQAVAWLMLYVMATWRMVPCLQNIYRNLARIRFYTPALMRLAQEFDEPILATPPPSQTRLRECIQLQGVHFSYPGQDQATLSDISLTIRKGQKVALVGRTGSGKTTLADLVAGLLPPDRGQVSVDGQPAEADWLSRIGYVPQEIFLSDDTIGANIALGLVPQAAALEKAAQAAQLQEVLAELPLGFDTPLGERGASLSGGQRQRIGIARALYQEPDLLIFDEATSALDELTQRNLLDSLRQIGQLTVLVIAHRLEVIRDCDHIVMLENGRVLGQGSYQELLEGCPAFAQMVAGG